MEHVFWLEHYPRSISGIIDYLAQSDRVYCVCYKSSIFDKRANMGWTKEDLHNVEFIYLDSNKDCVPILDFIKRHPVAFHYIMGVRYGGITEIVKKYLLIDPRCYVFMLSERPYLYGKGLFKRWMLISLYKYLGFKYRNRIKGVFAMGTLGCDAFKGWAHGNVFPFLYPHFISIKSDSESHKTTVPLKALYVGQLDKRKGIDLLIDTVELLLGGIELYVVGANGNIASESLQRINNVPNIHYLGVWSSEDLASNISEYDFCVVPSRYDGWGMFVMEAIEAGKGVITTNQVGSKDLVEASGAGLVIDSGNETALKRALLHVVNNPSVAEEWMIRAREYRCYLSKNSVGDYFRECTSYVTNKTVSKPNCPWLN